jgi:hypothetical protein
MIAGHIHYSSATFGVSKNTSNNIGVALLPSPFDLLDFPRINYVAYKIQGFTGVMLEKIV